MRYSTADLNTYSLDPIRCRVRLGIDPEDVNKDRIYGIQMSYGEVWGDLHGTGDDEFEIVLPEGEQLWAVVGKPVQGDPSHW